MFCDLLDADTTTTTSTTLNCGWFNFLNELNAE
jgi:hypothetical protein